MKFRILIAALTTVTLLSTSGCQKRPEPEKTTLVLMHGWGGDSRDHQVMQEIYGHFEELHPNVKLIIDASPDISIVIEKATDMLAVDRIPDIISTNGLGNYAENAVRKKTALNLSPYIGADSEFLSCLPEEIAARIDRGEAVYTVPDIREMQGFWYNADILTAAGVSEAATAPSYLCRTWEAFFTMCDVVTRRAAATGDNVIPFVLQNEQYLSLLGALLGGSAEPEFRGDNADGTLGTADGKARFFDRNTIIAALRMLKRIASYAEISTGTASIKDARDSFLRGESAFFFNGVWDSVVLNDSGVCGAVHHVPYPSEIGKTVAYRFYPNGYVLGNRGGTDKILWATEFLKYMVSTEVQQRIAYETLQIPVNPRIDISPSGNSNPLFSEAYANIRQAEIAVESMYRIWPQAAVTYFLTQIDDCLQGTLSPETLANALIARF